MNNRMRSVMKATALVAALGVALLGCLGADDPSQSEESGTGIQFSEVRIVTGTPACTGYDYERRRTGVPWCLTRCTQTPGTFYVLGPSSNIPYGRCQDAAEWFCSLSRNPQGRYLGHATACWGHP